MDELFALPFGPLLIFSMRMVDVSMATMRMIFAVRGYRGIAAFIGFFEVLIWLLAVGSALAHIDSAFHVIGYAAGFATGNYVGVSLEARFAIGLNVVRAICVDEVGEVGLSAGRAAAEELRATGYAVTEMQGKGRESSVEILNVVTPRKKVPEVINILQAHDPDVFVTVEEVRSRQGGYIRPGGRKFPFLTQT